MNLLFLNENQIIESKGGVERVTSILSNYFISKNINVYHAYFTSNKSTKFQIDNEYQLSNSKISCSENIQLLSKIINYNNISIVINQIGFNRNVVKLLKNLNLDITVFSCLHSSPDYRIIFNKILISGGFSFDEPILNNIKKLLKPIYFYFLKFNLNLNLKYVYKHSDRVILLSERYINSFLKTSNLNTSNKLISIPNPNNPNFKYNIKNLNNKEKTILYVGRLQNGKRVNLLLLLWKKIYQVFPDWKMIIVGDGPDFTNTKIMINELNLDNITLVGHSKKVEEYYKKASIFISLSAFEGFPMVLSEAILFGVVPIVYNTFESVTDLIINEKTGYIINELDEYSLINKLKILMSNKMLRENMAIKGSEMILKYDINKVWNLWNSLLKDHY
jgi:glycosyltransferase involved in cell wall biosynthesis